MQPIPYNDGNVPFGVPQPSSGIVLMRGQTSPTTLGNYLLEGFTISRPTKKVTRPDQQGGPNGRVLVSDYNTATGVLQMALATSTFPQNGDWFLLTTDPNIPNEKWVIEDDSEPYEMQGYYKKNVSLFKAIF